MRIPGGGQPDPNFYLFLMFGQSNMAGTPHPESQDLGENPRVRVLGFSECAERGRHYNQWSTASPPLHACDLGVGPGDYFGKAMADAFPAATIGLVPCAVAGVDIAYFQKGVVSKRRGEFVIPPDNHWTGAYEWVVTRAKLAQQAGVIRGILFHQGESDAGDPAWPGKVKGIVEDLRSDLGLGPVPFIAGELLYGGRCEGHNLLVDKLPNGIVNTSVVSAEGLRGLDAFHFDLAAQRELGKRYGRAMISALTP